MSIIVFTFAFIIITFLHCSSLFLQSRYKLYTRLFKNKGFAIHFSFTAILWMIWGALFLNSISETKGFVLPFFNPLFPPIGLFINLIGLILIIWSGLLLGIRRAWGIRYFDPKFVNSHEKRGPYKYLDNPIYDGFIMLAFGKALMNNSMTYLIISIECFIIFNVFLSNLENKKIV